MKRALIAIVAMALLSVRPVPASPPKKQFQMLAGEFVSGSITKPADQQSAVIGLTMKSPFGPIRKIDSISSRSRRTVTCLTGRS